MVSIEYRDLLVAVWAHATPGFFCAKAEDEFGRTTPTVRIYLPFDDRWFVQFADSLEELSSKELHYVGARLFCSTPCSKARFSASTSNCWNRSAIRARGCAFD